MQEGHAAVKRSQERSTKPGQDHACCLREHAGAARKKTLREGRALYRPGAKQQSATWGTSQEVPSSEGWKTVLTKDIRRRCNGALHDDGSRPEDARCCSLTALRPAKKAPAEG